VIKRLKAKIAYHLINFDEPEYAFDHFVQPQDESPAVVTVTVTMYFFATLYPRGIPGAI
jgi:hypothetical protein